MTFKNIFLSFLVLAISAKIIKRYGEFDGNTWSLGPLYASRADYPKGMQVPPLALSWIREVEEPFRTGKGIAIKNVSAGVWKRPERWWDDELVDEFLSEVVDSRALFYTPTVIGEWDG